MVCAVSFIHCRFSFDITRVSKIDSLQSCLWLYQHFDLWYHCPRILQLWASHFDVSKLCIFLLVHLYHRVDYRQDEVLSMSYSLVISRPRRVRFTQEIPAILVSVFRCFHINTRVNCVSVCDLTNLEISRIIYLKSYLSLCYTLYSFLFLTKTAFIQWHMLF